jgi:hypothetical protein
MPQKPCVDPIIKAPGTPQEGQAPLKAEEEESDADKSSADKADFGTQCFDFDKQMWGLVSSTTLIMLKSTVPVQNTYLALFLMARSLRLI